MFVLILLGFTMPLEGLACDKVVTEEVGTSKSILELLKDLSPVESFELCLESGPHYEWKAADCSWVQSSLTIRGLQSVPLHLELFTCALLAPGALLVFENLRLTGTQLLVPDCEEEWCTHCLTPDFLVPSPLGPATVIESHLVTPELPESVLCEGNHLSSFFQVAAGTQLIFRNCEIVNVRIRAKAFVELLGGSVFFLQTQIFGLDFAEGFILQTDISTTSSVSLELCSVSGLNRDHPFHYPSDSGFLQASALSSLSLVSVLLQDNFLMPSSQVTVYFLKVDDLGSLELVNTTIRRCMGSFSLSLSPHEAGVFLWANSTYELSYSEGSSNWEIFLNSAILTIVSLSYHSNLNYGASGVHVSVIRQNGPSQALLKYCTFSHNLVTVWIR